MSPARAPKGPLAPIEAYGEGGFRIAGAFRKGGLLVLPSGLAPLEALEALAGEGLDFTGVELLLVGTGLEMRPLPEALRSRLARAGLRLEVMATGAAARTFNVLLAEGRRVGVALLPV